MHSKMKVVVEDVISELDEEEEKDPGEDTVSEMMEEVKPDQKVRKRESMRIKYPVENKRDQKFQAKQHMKNVNAVRLGREDIKHQPLD